MNKGRGKTRKSERQSASRHQDSQRQKPSVSQRGGAEGEGRCWLGLRGRGGVAGSISGDRAVSLSGRRGRQPRDPSGGEATRAAGAHPERTASNQLAPGSPGTGLGLAEGHGPAVGTFLG